MAISRITAVWQGFPGAPGYSSFFFDAFGGGDLVDAEHARVRSFFLALQTILPSGLTVTVNPEAEVLDETTGELLGYSNVTEPSNQVNGAATGAYSGPAGAAVTWNTDTVAKGRRLRGRTFVVPLANSAYDSQGTLATSAITDLNEGAEDLIGDGSGPQLVIWSRPAASVAGSIGPVTSHRVADKVAVLRSRRD